MAKFISPSIIVFFLSALSLFISAGFAGENPPAAVNDSSIRIIIKLNTGKTPDDIDELKNYYVLSAEKIYSAAPRPREALKELREQLAGIENGHERWYWQMEKDSEEYKNHEKNIARRKKELDEQIRAFEELINHLEQRQRRAPANAALPELSDTYLVKLESSRDPSEIAAELSGNASIAYAEPDYPVTADMVPNDPYYSSSGSWGQSYADLWGLKKIRCETAWNYTQGSGIIVAVIDTGIDYTHSDLKNNIWTNARETAGNSKDDDKNGYIDDTRGWDFANKDKNPLDDNGHGTQVTGIIAATGNNRKGIIGIAPKAKVMAIKGLKNTLSGSVSNMVNAIKYAADNGADVINMSWTMEGDSTALTEAVKYAYAKGCVMVASSGNYNKNASLYSPAKLRQVITVAATDHTDVKSDFSDFGSKIDVSAPGGDSFNTSIKSNYKNILSLKASIVSSKKDCVVDTNYYRVRGTSFSTPYVSGLAALLLSRYTDWSNELIRNQMRNTADNIDSLNTSYRGQMGTGRINADNAVTKTYYISGYAKLPSGAGVSGVIVKFSGLSSVTTNSSGYYKKSGIPNGKYTMTLTRTGYTFPSYTATVNNANRKINFTGKKK
ncbi:MAG: S8 family serine peptidase [Candidatus Omnitrophica bacterium]|nr:S8 family serine peptidase [Candidatus Omnitrophota bacterium]